MVEKQARKTLRLKFFWVIYHFLYINNKGLSKKVWERKSAYRRTKDALPDNCFAFNDLVFADR